MSDDLTQRIALVLAASFWARVDRSSVANCWPWTGERSRHGYGYMWTRTGSRRAHRVAYELTVGPIPEGLVLDHLCRNRLCVNPDHLEPVTSAVNTHRSPISPTALNALKTHCPEGHPYEGRNLVVDARGSRNCRACSVERTRRWRQRKRLELVEVTP